MPKSSTYPPMPKAKKRNVNKIEKKIHKSMKKSKQPRATWHEPFNEKDSDWNMAISFKKQKTLGQYCGKLEISNEECNSVKYDSKTEKQVVKWLESMIDDVKITGGGPTKLHKCLRDGEALCLLANKLKKGSVSKDIIKENLESGHKGQSAYAKIANKQRITAAVEAFVKRGLPEAASFCAEDLTEGKDMAAVLMCLYTLGRMCNSGDIKGGGKGIKATGQGKHNLK